MANHALPRSKRRRSSCPSFLWILVLTWAVLMVGSNVARVLLLPDFFVWAPKREEVPRPPNYYEILGVTPMVNDTTLRQLRRKYNVQYHPDKVGDDPDAIKTFLKVQEAFDTLSDGRRRCEYDKEHRIKGKWLVQTCRGAFREEYKRIEREMYEKYLEVESEKNKKITGIKMSAPGSSDPEDDELAVHVKPTMPKTGKSSSRKSKSKPKSSRVKGEDGRPPSPETEARLSVPVVTVEKDNDKEDAVEVITTSIGRIWEWWAEQTAYTKAILAARWREFTSYFDWIGRLRLARDYEYHEHEEP